MGWKLSRFRAGDWIEVRSREEILATLDARGCLDGIPFMPEMLALCGRRFRVRAVAHKTCDTAKQTWTGRRLDTTVHLEGANCSGSAHGGCEAACTLFWKDAWLVAADQRRDAPAMRVGSSPTCTETDLHAHTRHSTPPGEPTRYACQATELFDYTAPLRVWDVRQYWYDVRTGNHSAHHVAGVLLLSWIRWLLPRVPIGYRMFHWLSDRLHVALTGRPTPALAQHVPQGERTPTGQLGLEPGEYVRIKSQREIEPTLDARGRNRGLTFDPQEMAPYCGSVVRVRRSVHRIIDEPTGRMIEMKHPCIMLDGVVCRSLYAPRRLNCPRAITSYWREIWLERVDPPEVAGAREPSDR